MHEDTVCLNTYILTYTHKHLTFVLNANVDLMSTGHLDIFWDVLS